jgi:cytochrome P450
MTTFLAGHETTAATLTWWAWCMASNPSAQDAARAEVTHVLRGQAPTADSRQALRQVVQTITESMRLYPVAPLLISRRAVRPITLGPWRLPARAVHAALAVDAPRSALVPGAGRFQPDRFSTSSPQAPRGAYMPFGTGPRVCQGQHLATAEMTVIAAMLLAVQAVGAGRRSIRGRC